MYNHVRMTTFLFILICILFGFTLNLRARVDTLEKRLRERSVETKQVTSDVPSPVASVEEPAITAPAPAYAPMPKADSETVFSPSIPVPPPVPAEPRESQLLAWFKEQTLIKIGSLIFFLGAVWFVSYAIEQNWISPIMRIVLGVLLGVAGYALAYTRQGKDDTQYQVITVLGTGIVLGSVVASQFAFTTPIVPAFLAGIIMVLSLAYTVYVAVRTKTEWIGIISAIAGFLVPFLVVTDNPSATTLLSYGFLLSACLLTVAFMTAWRVVTLTSFIGAALYLLTVSETGVLAATTMWLFAAVYSLLFFVVTTISLWRTRNPLMLDASILGLVGLQFVGFSVEYLSAPALAVFCAAVLVAGTGYALQQRGAGERVIALYVALSSIGILIATTLQFDGFVLTVAYALEVLMVFILALRLGKTENSVTLSFTLFLLPIITGIGNLIVLSDSTTALQAETVGVLTVIGVLGAAWYATMTYKRETNRALVEKLVPVFAVALYLFGMATVSVVAGIYDSIIPAVVSVLVCATLVAMVALFSLVKLTKIESPHILGLFSLVLPTILALDLILTGDLSLGGPIATLLATGAYLLCLIAITTRYWAEALDTNAAAFFGAIAYGLTWIAMLLCTLFFSELWSNLPNPVADVLIALTWLLVPYLTVNILLWLQQPINRVSPVLFVFAVPLLLLLDFYEFSGWPAGVFALEAIALYVAVTVLALLGKTLYDQGETFRQGAVVILVLAGLKAFGLVWMISQSLFEFEAIAVTVALLVYTITGLYLYVQGQIKGSIAWRRAGRYLLIAVVVRLLLVDVWAMEQVWQIVTFLTVGGLFIGAALYESSKRKQQEQIDTPSI